jgi:hypothetical protein
MRYYFVDEISPSDMERVHSFLKEKASASPMEGLLWVSIPKDRLSHVQIAHSDCQPHFFAIELGTDWLKAEMFIRGQDNVRCTCSTYATSEQHDYIIHYVQDMIDTLDIQT